MKEVRVPQRNTDEPTSFNAVQQPTDWDGADRVEDKDGEWRLEQSRYSKWYRVKPKGQLEFGLSFVRVRSWVQRFIKNWKRPENQREFGEKTPAELRRVETEIFKETQNKTFIEDITALKSNKPLLKGSSLLPFTPILVDGLLRSNTRLRHSEDRSMDVKFPIILSKKNPVSRLIIKYH